MRLFSQANTDHIKAATDQLDSASMLKNIYVNRQVSVFNETVFKVMSNFKSYYS